MYTTETTNWSEETPLTPENQNRVESNIKALKSEGIEISGNKTFSGDNTHSGDNSFTGEVDIESGTFKANGYSTTGAGTLISSASANGGDGTGSDFTITKPTTVYGTFNTTATSGFYNLRIQLKVNTTEYINNAVSVSINVAQTSTGAVTKGYIILNPGTYRLYIVQNSSATGAVTGSIYKVGVFGDDSI